jgi:hypothetical protein
MFPVVSRAEYDAINGLNWSLLKHMRVSPLHLANARKAGVIDTPPMARGRGGHTAVFEPDRFALDFAVWTGDRRAGKEWEAFKAAHAGRTILKEDEYQACLAMRDAVRAHPAAGAAIAHGQAEVTVTWEDPVSGTKCKSRQDWIGGTILDLKTTADIDRRRFAASAFRYGYVHQLAWYRWGVECATGVTSYPCQIIAVESEAPHDVALYTLDELDLGAALEEVKELLARYVECERAGSWPGRFGSETTLPMPPWAWNDEDAASELGLIIGNGKAA